MKAAIYLTVAGILYNASAHGQNDLAEGQQLFRTYCSACHDVHSEIYGPQLASITKKRNREWLYAFIQNSQQVIISGDSYARYLFEQYDRAVMPSFQHLSQAHINEIISYISYESGREVNKTEDRGASAGILRGKQIFQDQCKTCHSINFEKDAPALGSVSKRLPYPWLKNFIHNSQKVIRSGDHYANDLYNQFDDKVMVSMEFLTDDDIKDVLAYIQYISTAHMPEDPHAGGIEQSSAVNLNSKSNYSFFLFATLGILTLTTLLFLVARLLHTLGKEN